MDYDELENKLSELHAVIIESRNKAHEALQDIADIKQWLNKIRIEQAEKRLAAGGK